MAKAMHYHTTFEKCKHNIKETWNTIKKIIQKTATGDKLPDYFKIDGNIVGDKPVITNKFNTFFYQYSSDTCFTNKCRRNSIICKLFKTSML